MGEEKAAENITADEALCPWKESKKLKKSVTTFSIHIDPLLWSKYYAGH